MANKWTPSTPLSLAIAKLEEQNGGTLRDWGTAEHIACLRYLVIEACQAAEVPLSVGQKSAIKVAFHNESDFVAYASNAKKKLVEFGSLSAKQKAEQYE